MILLNGTFKAYLGSYVGEPNNPNCKENKNIVVTMDYNWNETRFVQCGIYKRNYKGHKAGDVKYIRRHPLVYKEEYKDENKVPALYKVWKAAKQFPTVSYNFNKYEHANLIVDVDEYFKSLEEAEFYISRKSPKNMPKPSYIIRNPKSGHIQFGWFTTLVQNKEKEKYNKAIKVLAEIYNSDACFNGPACKNPYYEGFDVSSIDEKIHNIDSLYEIINRNSSILPLPSFSSYNIRVEQNTKESIKKTTSKKHYFGNESSRDYWECKLLREWIWDYMRNNGIAPSYEETRNQLNTIAFTAARMTEKTVHKPNELNNLCSCTYKWAVSKFDDTSKEGKYRKSAEIGNKIQKLQAYLLALTIKDLRNKGMTVRETAQKLGCSIGTVSKANKIELDEIKKEADDFNEIVINHNVCNEYKELNNRLQQMLSIFFLSSFSSYNIRVEQNNNGDTNHICEINGQEKNTNKLLKMQSMRPSILENTINLNNADVPSICTNDLVKWGYKRPLYLF